MATREIINYDQHGIVSIETIELPDIDIDIQIKSKEEHLISIYEEIQQLKNIKEINNQ